MEFGPHKRFITDENLFKPGAKSYPVLFMLSAISFTFKKRLIVLCDKFNLAFFHKNSNIINILPEEFDSSTETLILTLTNHGIISNPKLKDESIVCALMDYSIVSTLELNKSFLEQYLDIDYYSDNTKESGTNDSVKISQKNLNNQYNIMPIKEFVQTYSSIDESGEIKVLDTAYSNDSRIDYHLSDHRIEAMEEVEYDRTFDIDGFFSILKPNQLASCVNSGGKIVMVDKLEYAKIDSSLKKLLLD